MRLSLVVGLCLIAGCANGGGIERRTSGDSGPIDVATMPTDAGSLVDAPTGDPCGPGATRFCTTSCGSHGVSSCDASGFFGPCVPPVEDCNAADDDCDGMTDESIAARACSSACGGGNETCVSGHWMGCTAVTPGAETCNAIDDDCDSHLDEGLTRGCTTACGSGTETCSAGAYVGCTAASPRPETCNAMDDDCDGMTDEMLTRACMNACHAAGTETCTGGSYMHCTAPAVPVETCNAMDDDCDGTTDESLQVAVYDGIVTGQVTAYQPSCAGPGSSLDVCLSAAKRWCSARGCAIGGAGFLEGAGGVVRVACVGNHATERLVSFAQVASDLAVAFDESMAGQRVASSYSNRWCTRQGFAAGIGPIEHSGGNMYVDCLASDQASVERVPTLSLELHSCDPTVDAEIFDCSIAADQVCRERGFRAGWGPVEWNDSETYLVCFH
jgi:hypothetical protein